MSDRAILSYLDVFPSNFALGARTKTENIDRVLLASPSYEPRLIYDSEQGCMQGLQQYGVRAEVGCRC